MDNTTDGDPPDVPITARIDRPVALAIHVPCGERVPLGCWSAVLIGPPDDGLGANQSLRCLSR